MNKNFLRDHSSAFTLMLRVADVAIIVFAALLAFAIKFGNLQLAQREILSMTIAVLLANLIWAELGIYRSWRTGSIAHEISLLWLGWGLTFLLLTGLIFALKLGETYSRVWVALWFAIAGIALGSAHLALRQTLRWARKRGYNVRKVCIVGSGESAQHAIHETSQQPRLGFKPIAWFGTEQTPPPDQVLTVGALSDLESYANTNLVDEFWVAVPLREERLLRIIFHSLRYSTADIRYIPGDLFGLELLNHTVTEIGGMPMMDLSVSPMQGVNQLVKRLEDLMLGSIFLLIATPIMLLVAIGVKLTSPGPVLFKQTRIGWSGGEFTIYKFRTMHVEHQPKSDELPQATKNDPRVTRFGRFLRRSSLDELPQLFNVIQGRMSLVGPRPHAVEHHSQYIDIVPSYAARHKVKPGITGMAQISGYRGETETLEKMKKRIEYDLLYINNWSVWFDLKILWLTLFYGFSHKNAY
ncbi:MAG: undecaprenyl-phosphate glucose phosphotransferase [Acidobacteriaceae bacterium]